MVSPLIAALSKEYLYKSTKGEEQAKPCYPILRSEHIHMHVHVYFHIYIQMCIHILHLLGVMQLFYLRPFPFMSYKAIMNAPSTCAFPSMHHLSLLVIKRVSFVPYLGGY